MKRYLIAAALFLACAGTVHAQVGSTPANSPFRDIEKKMEVSILGGSFSGGGDPVGIAPKSGAYVGARYEYAIGSLFALTGRTGIAITKRNLVNPTQPAASRLGAEVDQKILMVDAGLAVSPTGSRAFHGFAPVLNIGVGLATDGAAKDGSGYAMTPRFMLALGGGIKWLLNDTWVVKADVSDYMLSIKYPASYFSTASDGTRARVGDESVYTHNLALSLGLSYRFFR